MTTENAKLWVAAKRLFQCVTGKPDSGILYRSNKDPRMAGFIDSDWKVLLMAGSLLLDMFSFFCLSAVTWTCKKQQVVGLSLLKAEH